MAQPREHLGKAPIVEAVIDFRVPQVAGVRSDAFSNLTSSIGEKYSKPEPINLIEARFGIDQGKMLDPAQSKTDLGWRYKAETEIVQFRIDGFTFSKIEPYTTWNEVFGEAFRLWRVYLNVAKPAQLSRIAVRYINRMQVPGNQKISDFIKKPPVVPLPESSTELDYAIRVHMLDFLTRIRIADHTRGAEAIVVQAIESKIDPNAMSLYLDIDAYKLDAFEPDTPQLPELFQGLREFKNEIFYASITEMAVEKYQ